MLIIQLTLAACAAPSFFTDHAGVVGDFGTEMGGLLLLATLRVRNGIKCVSGSEYAPAALFLWRADFRRMGDVFA